MATVKTITATAQPLRRAIFLPVIVRIGALYRDEQQLALAHPTAHEMNSPAQKELISLNRTTVRAGHRLCRAVLLVVRIEGE